MNSERNQRKCAREERSIHRGGWWKDFPFHFSWVPCAGWILSPNKRWMGFWDTAFS